jgi:hypothetical protein
MKQCVLCDKHFTEWGNNPWPLAKDGQCCDECDCLRVIPARILHLGFNARAAVSIGEQLYRDKIKRKQQLHKEINKQ